ncbi:PilZ domain-containing protein [Marinobacter sp. SS13-12]|uniref:PilZ domain-containing protein n=1 Tax=Marinobacter sp. SS13-12 TaxID=3050451 RepID=UPI002552C754|nr:PilZ domain-containing protein [Marinobacter sp. SS13-12]MDK8464020.1 PilZ domain-containing protein [Marinobacter sp. SS13-12]
MSEFMKNYSEKRDFHRMTMNLEIELTDSNGVTFPGICKDLSGTGMQLFVERAFSEGDEINTLLPTTSEQFPPFETVCRVLRCEPDGDGFLLGMEIVEIKR